MVLFNELKFLTADNVQGIFDRLFASWVRINSDEYANEIEKSTISQRAVRIYKIVCPFSPWPRSDSVSTCSGVPLTEKTFIKEQIKCYQPIYDKTEGSQENRKENYLLGLWLEFLKEKQKGLVSDQKTSLGSVNALALYCALSELPAHKLESLGTEQIEYLYKEFGVKDKKANGKRPYKRIILLYRNILNTKKVVRWKNWDKYYDAVIDVAKIRKDESVLQGAEKAKKEYENKKPKRELDDTEEKIKNFEYKANKLKKNLSD